LIKETAESLFGTNARPAAILLTHVHPDHSGSALELSQLWDVPVFLHSDELPLTTGTIAAIEAYPAGPLDRWLILPVLRTMPRRWEAMLVKGSFKDRARPFDPDGSVPGLPDWEYIPTPGHSPGHVSFFRPSDRVLITGDAVVTMKVNSLWGFLLHQPGLSGPPWYTTSSWSDAKESIAALARLEPQVLASGHGSPMIGPDTARALQALADHPAGHRVGKGNGVTRSRDSGRKHNRMKYMLGSKRRAECQARHARGSTIGAGADVRSRALRTED
jgi:glyoxylase-like metal-dependent hydrolase (beta-lactamase superfamily II)